MDTLHEWLLDQGKKTKAPVLLVRGDAEVPTEVALAISSGAQKAGFLMPVHWAAADPADYKGR